MLQDPHVLLTFDKVHNPLRLPRESTSERPKVLRARQFFALLTWKCASCHNGVHFFISHLASWLRSCFGEPTRDFPTFSRTWIFFLLRLSLSSSLLLSDSSHLCFSSVHIVGSLTSKLPSIIVLVKIQICRVNHGETTISRHTFFCPGFPPYHR